MYLYKFQYTKTPTTNREENGQASLVSLLTVGQYQAVSSSRSSFLSFLSSLLSPCGGLFSCWPFSPELIIQVSSEFTWKHTYNIHIKASDNVGKFWLLKYTFWSLRGFKCSRVFGFEKKWVLTKKVSLWEWMNVCSQKF